MNRRIAFWSCLFVLSLGFHSGSFVLDHQPSWDPHLFLFPSCWCLIPDVLALDLRSLGDSSSPHVSLSPLSTCCPCLSLPLCFLSHLCVNAALYICLHSIYNLVILIVCTVVFLLSTCDIYSTARGMHPHVLPLRFLPFLFPLKAFVLGMGFPLSETRL